VIGIAIPNSGFGLGGFNFGGLAHAPTIAPLMGGGLLGGLGFGTPYNPTPNLGIPTPAPVLTDVIDLESEEDEEDDVDDE
jgi:hypothetical protein